MIKRSLMLSLTIFCSPFICADSNQSACQNDDQFICGPVNPEDILPIPDTDWVIASSTAPGGGLYVINTDGGPANTRLFPTTTSRQVQDKDRYPDCPGPLTDAFIPHGLGLQMGDGDIHTLYVVGHGQREAVEVFNLDNGGQVPTLSWIGCAVAPEGLSLNSVAPLPNGAFATTNFNLAGGEVWEWQLQKGWAKVPGSEMSGPNGLLTSADGQWLYIGGWGDQAMVRLSRGKTPIETASVKTKFHIDNLRWGSNGTIIAAGQNGEPINVGTCLSQNQCGGISTGVAKIDLNTMTVTGEIDYPSIEQLPMGTVAIEINDEVWVSGIAGSTRIGRAKF